MLRCTMLHRSKGVPMVQLVLVYCLLANNSVCNEKRPFLEGLSSFSGCMVAAQQIAAAYEADHPSWHLSRIKCEMGRRPESRSL